LFVSSVSFFFSFVSAPFFSFLKRFAVLPLFLSQLFELGFPTRIFHPLRFLCLSNEFNSLAISKCHFPLFLPLAALQTLFFPLSPRYQSAIRIVFVLSPFHRLPLPLFFFFFFLFPLLLSVQQLFYRVNWTKVTRPGISLFFSPFRLHFYSQFIKWNPKLQASLSPSFSFEIVSKAVTFLFSGFSMLHPLFFPR